MTNAIQDQASAVNLQPTDVLLGQQAVGPVRSNQTVRVTPAQIITTTGGPFLPVAGGALGGAVTTTFPFTVVSFTATGLATIASLTVTGPLAISSLAATGAQSFSLPPAKTGTSYTVGVTDYALVLTPSGTFTLTLPAASAIPGRVLHLKLTAAFAVNSAASIVVPLAGGAAGTAIMPATAGKYSVLQSDGASWQIMAAN